MHALKLTQIGNSVGLVLPKEMLARLKLEKGDTVYLMSTRCRTKYGASGSASGELNEVELPYAVHEAT